VFLRLNCGVHAGCLFWWVEVRPPRKALQIQYAVLNGRTSLAAYSHDSIAITKLFWRPLRLEVNVG
jgi:hypothetical protein